MMRRSLGWLLILALALTPLAGPRPARAELVRWTDEKGEAHIGELDDVPDRYKKFAKSLGTPEEAKAPACLAAKDAPPGGAKIRFKYTEHRRIYVYACINGKGPVALIFDTGAFATILSARMLQGFGVSFKDAQVTGISSAYGSQAALVVKLESLQVEGARVGPIHVAAADMGFGEEHGPLPIVGLLGQDFLSKFNVDIDNSRGIAVLTPKDRPASAKSAPPGAAKAGEKKEKR